MTIPAAALVTILPGVLSAGGAGVTLSGVINTQDTSIPIGTAQKFISAAAVSSWFGPTSPQANMANAYFSGYIGGDLQPGALYFWQANTQGPVAAYLRGGNAAALTLAQIQALSGTITINVNGANVTSSAINLSGATSPANAATLITTAFSGGQVVCTYDALRQAFVLTSNTTGSASTIAYPTTAAITTGLLLTAATGAVLSQGAAQATQAGTMNALVNALQNWATFTTDYAATQTENLAYAAWVQTVNPAGAARFAMFPWENAVPPTQGSAPTSLGGTVKANNYIGVAPIWDASAGVKAAFAMGIAASLNTNALAGRPTWAFKGQAGLTPDVTDPTTASNLISNGYNFYGAYATAQQQFNLFQPGQMPGPWLWIDSYINQIALNSDLQAAILTVLTTFKSIPYNVDGTAIWRAGFADTITKYKNFGGIVVGGVLTATQAANINNAAGNPGAAAAVTANGYYLLIGVASPQVQAARGSPPMTLWYFDGNSVQSVTLNSINVQ